MRYKAADMHVHSDSYVDRYKSDPTGFVHGIHPRNLAEALHRSPLSCAALTEHHNKKSEIPCWEEVQAELDKIRRSVAKLTDGPAGQLAEALERRILGHRKPAPVPEATTLLQGVELRLRHCKAKKGFHVGHIFEEPFDPRDLPRKDFSLDFGELEQFIKQFPGVTTLNHALIGLPPFYRGRLTKSHIGRAACELLETGLFDALEVLNGDMLTDPNIEIERTIATIRFGLAMQRYLASKGVDIALTGGSDAHEAEEIGLCSTLYPDNMDLITAVRTGNTQPAILNPPKWLEQKIAPLQRWVVRMD